MVGHAWPLWRDPLAFLKELRDTGDLARVDIGTMPVVFVNSAELAWEVMVTQAAKFHKGRFFDRLRSLVGDGLATSDGPVHRQHRRLMQPMFHRERIAGYAELMGRRARELADSWQAGQTLDVGEVMAQWVVTTLAETMFSAEIGKPAAEVVQRNVPIIIENLLIRTLSPRLLDGLPIPANRRFDAATRELHKVIDEVVSAVRQAGDGDQPDLLSTLIAARDADTGEALTDTEVRDELGTILFAGTETTATTLAWAFHEIARHPQVEKQLLAELDEVVGHRPVTFEDVTHLPYLRRVIDEVTRLHGVTLLMRRATEPVEIGGVTVPEGTEVAFSLYALHQDPRLFPQPERFDPDRWLPERTEGVNLRQAFLPFGAGNRKCIGDAFSWTEITILLATVLPRWQLQHEPGSTPREIAAAVPRPDHLSMIVRDRRD
ncbi:cytochrome P450 [Kitasatospora kazusensis]|uniref:Cytochrome P450 n=1 Tax=Kitasatospora kazusensis TaxID=407974 RepID=A0ABN1ZMC8_9ACTN